ncbi:helix-turn-helix domain-containing protein [Paenibacillus caui]|uniref:helix-turn-helix domain-containing protein n=1 Tax=Paenibacillus caui TaxID=2873927 RepID=UPI001CA7FCAF|nr:helix-turn-helix transcriptional regulator [Paenibacillus caui]
MPTSTKILTEMEQYIKREGLSISRFAEKAEMNPGSLSKIMSGNRYITVEQLDKVTVAMGLPGGTFYDEYVDELSNTPLDWRRLGPFLERCAQMDKLDTIERIAILMMDNLAYSEPLFDMAESWFQAQRWPAAAILYRTVAESEKYQHSHRLALCQYRLFSIALCEDQDINLRAATTFEGYVDRLDDIDRLDALKDLIDIYASLHRFDKVDELALTMGTIANIQYQLKQNATRHDEPVREPTKSLIGYILYSYLMRGIVCGERGDFEKALAFVSLYDNPDWVRETDDATVKTLEMFHFYAIGNKLIYKMKAGDQEALYAFMDTVAPFENEILPALFDIIKAANTHHWNIDGILEQYHELIVSSCKDGPVNHYTKQVINDDFAHFLCDLACYYLDQEIYSVGVKWVLKSLLFSSKMYNEGCIIRCVGLFEQYRHTASGEDQTEYQKIILEVQKENEKKKTLTINRHH